MPYKCHMALYISNMNNQKFSFYIFNSESSSQWTKKGFFWGFSPKDDASIQCHPKNQMKCHFIWMLDKFMKNAKLIIITVISYDKKYFHLMKENSYLQIIKSKRLKKLLFFWRNLQSFVIRSKSLKNFLEKPKIFWKK